RLDDLTLVERVADADAPISAVRVVPGGLDIAARIDEEIPDAGSAQPPRRVKDGPALDDAAGVQEPLRPPDVEIAIGLAPGALGERQHVLHFGAGIAGRDPASIEGADLAL